MKRFSLILLLICYTSLNAEITESAFVSATQDIKHILSSDVISQERWKDFVKQITYIQEHGTQKQITDLQELLKTYRLSIAQFVENTVSSTCKDQYVLEFLAALTKATVYGVLPTLGFKSLQILSGNLNLATATQELIDVGCFAALDALITYTLKARTQALTPFEGFTSSALATVAQDFIGYAGTRPSDIPFLGPRIIQMPLFMGITNSVTILVNKELKKKGGVPGLLSTVDWKEAALGSEALQIQENHPSLYQFLVDNLKIVLQNPVVREATATTVSYAIEGALVGAVMHQLGLGFYTESTVSAALGNSMFRGALEGLYHYTRYGQRNLGIVQRLEGGFIGSSLAKYVQTGTPALSALEVTPFVIRQLATGAVNSIVRQSGGWMNSIRSLFRK